MFRLLFLSVTLICSAIAVPAEAAFAIAFNPDTGKATASNGSPDLEKVKLSAMSSCGAGCRVVASGQKNCAAVVESISVGAGARAWAVAFGTMKETATASAVADCQRKGGKACKMAAAICD